MSSKSFRVVFVAVALTVSFPSPLSSSSPSALGVVEFCVLKVDEPWVDGKIVQVIVSWM